MPDLPAALAAFFASHPVDGRHLCVAFSGGRDSVALLHALAHHLPVSCRLSALHVHHGISAFADDWAGFCQNFCDRLAVPLSIVPVVVDRAASDGLEAAARRARYAVFVDATADDILLAHHQADQAETVLLNLLRGTGLQGLSGMPEERPLAVNSGPRLLRPLLSVPRQVLETYLAAHALPWIEDESNQNIRLRRNYLRQEILPRLETVFPQAKCSLARTAAHLADSLELMTEIADLDWQVVAQDQGGWLADGSVRISLTRLFALSRVRQMNVLRYMLRSAGLQLPDRRYLQEMLRQFSCSTDAHPLFILTDGCMRVHRDSLYLLPDQQVVPVSQTWQGESVLPWGEGRVHFLRCMGMGIRQEALITGRVFLGFRRGGESLRLGPGRPRRALKKILQESGLPPWQRQVLPLLFFDQTLLWVGGLEDSGLYEYSYCAQAGEAGMLLHWERPQARA